MCEDLSEHHRYLLTSQSDRSSFGWPSGRSPRIPLTFVGMGIPLHTQVRLAWDVTAHRSQGLTLLRTCFALLVSSTEFSGRQFVTLSRVRSLVSSTGMIMHNFELARIWKLGGQNLEYRQGDIVQRRWPSKLRRIVPHRTILLLREEVAEE